MKQRDDRNKRKTDTIEQKRTSKTISFQKRDSKIQQVHQKKATDEKDQEKKGVFSYRRNLSELSDRFVTHPNIAEYEERVRGVEVEKRLRKVQEGLG